MRRGDVVIVEIAYVEGHGGKKRPRWLYRTTTITAG